MWDTLPNNADLDCFKTPILLEILRIQNLHQVEHCAFLEAIRLFQSVGCVRNKLQFRTVQQNQKSFPWMQAQRDLCPNLREVRAAPHKLQKRKTSRGMIDDQDNVDLFPQTSILLVRKLCCMCFQNPQSCSWLVVRQNQVGPQNPNQIHWHQKPTRRHIDEAMSEWTQEDAGEGRVTEKSKLMMNLVSRCSVRNPNVLAFAASESPGKTRYESQVPLSSWNEQQPRTGRPVKDACSSS